MDKMLKIYHGSDKIIEEPIFGEGKKNNDFGLGFYCSKDINLAKEWAITSLKDGYANCYTIDFSNMNILNLNNGNYTILNWIAILLEHRLFSIKTPIAKKARQYLIDYYGVNVNAYDIVIGYRADDSYFDYAIAFVNNSITVNQLAKAMMLGELGEQIVIKSKYAFSKLIFEGYDVANSNVYYVKRKERNDKANMNYYKMLEKEDCGLYIQDIIKGGIKNDDKRIPRIKY